MLRGLISIVVHLITLPVLSICGLIFRLVAPDWDAGPMLTGRIWSRAQVLAGGYKVIVHGAERFSPGPAVIVANHSSNVDVYALCATLPGLYRLTAKASLFRIPFLSLGMRMNGFIPLERSGSRRDVRRIDELDDQARRGARIVFFPEGTRSMDGRLQPFKSGAFYSALRLGVPVVPIAIAGAHRVQPRGSWRITPGLVELTVLEPLPVAGLAPGDRDALRAAAYAQIAAALPPDQQPPAATQ